MFASVLLSRFLYVIVRIQYHIADTSDDLPNLK